MSETDPDFVIRRATPEDAGGMVAILNPIIEARIYTAIDAPVTLESQRAFIEGFPARGILHVAEERPSGGLVGMQDVTPFWEHSAAFDHVGAMATYVDLAYHRRGIGARLFAATFDAAARIGYEKIFTYVRADNTAGLRAYLGQGFEVVGTARRHAKIDGRYIDEVLIERFL